MRQVPPSPVSHITPSIVAAVTQAFRTNLQFRGDTQLADALNTVRTSRRFADELARDATEAYARTVPSSRLTIDYLMVADVVEAMEDEFTSAMTFAAAVEIIQTTDRITTVAARASDFYHQDSMVRSAAHFG